MVVRRSADKLAETLSESMGHVILRNSGGFSQRRVGWGELGAELGINQRSKNRLPGTRTSAIPDKSKRIFSRTTNHSGELIYPFSKICGMECVVFCGVGGVVHGFFGQK